MDSLQVIGKSEKCGLSSMCLKEVQINLREDHVINMKIKKREISVKLDNSVFKSYHKETDDFVIDRMRNDVKIILKEYQVYIEFSRTSNELNINAPSHIYAGKLEGICGKVFFDSPNSIIRDLSFQVTVTMMLKTI